MRKALPLFSANLLYVVTMLLVALLGSTVQSLNLMWGLIFTEVALIALPVLLFLRRRRVPFKAGLRLNALSPLTALLCVILGVALSLFGLVVEGIMAQVTGLRAVDIPSSLLPTTAPDMVIYFVALAVFAPICEEMLFRGAVQGAYESRKSARFAIIITALMFTIYHFRLSGVPALLPIAFALGYVAWRTGSIYAAILIHFGNNATSALQSTTYFATGEGLPFVGPGAGLIGLILAIVILFIIRRLHPRSPAPLLQADAPVSPRAWLATYWPLILAGLLYAGLTGAQTITALAARVAPAIELEYGVPSLSTPVTTRYAITHQGGDPVGEMTCSLRSVASEVALECERAIRAYEYRTGSSFFADGNHHDVIRATWDSATMRLRDFSMEKDYADGAPRSSTVRDGVLSTVTPDGAESVTLDPTTLVEFEWAWRVALLKADSGNAFSLPFATLLTWNEKQGRSTPVVKDEILRVGDEEELSLGGRSVPSRRLTYGVREAWYAREDAISGLPRPVKFDDGALIYTMEQ